MFSLIECCLCDKNISSQFSLQIIFHQVGPIAGKVQSGTPVVCLAGWLAVRIVEW